MTCFSFPLSGSLVCSPDLVETSALAADRTLYRPPSSLASRTFRPSGSKIEQFPWKNVHLYPAESSWETDIRHILKSGTRRQYREKSLMRTIPAWLTLT
jgi:hypothetical protein